MRSNPEPYSLGSNTDSSTLPLNTLLRYIMWLVSFGVFTLLVMSSYYNKPRKDDYSEAQEFHNDNLYQ